jgi:hypothetical protein
MIQAQSAPLVNNNLSGNGGNNSANPSNTGRLILIKDLEPNQKGINLHAIVLEIGKPSQTKDGHEVRNIRIADKR